MTVRIIIEILSEFSKSSGNHLFENETGLVSKGVNNVRRLKNKKKNS